jgi:hypothetical protein
MDGGECPKQIYCKHFKRHMHIHHGWSIRKDLQIYNVHDHRALPPSRGHATLLNIMFDLWFTRWMGENVQNKFIASISRGTCIHTMV